MAKRKSAQKTKKPQKDDLQVLIANLKPIPFHPLKTLDFSSRESLLKRLGLWDFANLDFDRLASAVRADLIAQLVANFDRDQRCSAVDGARVSVCCADLARALKLPQNRDSEGIGMVTKESIRFVEDFLFNWMVLRDQSDETWIIPSEISDWVGAIKEGKFEKVDWAAMLWFMVENELMRGRELRNCYYATHLICLIKVPNGDPIHFVEEGENSSELSNFDAHEARIEEQNAIIKAQKAVIEEQNAVIEVQNAVIEEQRKREGSYEVKIEEQKAVIKEHEKRVVQEKEHALMMNLLKGYREALKRNQMAFSEFSERCQCKNLHEPIYKDVPGSSGLVLSVEETEKRESRLMIEEKMRDLKL